MPHLIINQMGSAVTSVLKKETNAIIGFNLEGKDKVFKLRAYTVNE
jgi:hypothetical protein